MGRRALSFVLVALTASACAAAGRLSWDRPLVPGASPTAGPVFVMEPVVVNPGGNIGRDYRAIRSEVANRVVAIVRERFPRADLVAARALPGARLAGYGLAAGPQGATAEEIGAARLALDRGATHLLVPEVCEWTEMRTDDPIGALILPHNRVSIALRLMRLDPPAAAGMVTFTNRARFTLNQKTLDLLDERFRQAVLQLLSGPGTRRRD